MTPPALRPVYSVAGYAVACDLPVPALEPLRSDRPPGFAIRRRPVPPPPQAPPVFDADARLGARICRVRSLSTPAGDFLEVSGAGAFSMPRGEACIDFDPAPGAGEDALIEALLGPALALALARRGIFVLHASAVVLPGGRAAGFLGESGAGKSTLAGLLVEASDGIALAADDLLAVQALAEGAVALPHFPQLKLGRPAMAGLAGLPPRIPLQGLHVLEPAPPEATAGAEVLPAAGAVAHLVRHTVAGKLFAGDLLAAHLGFAAALAGCVPLHRLTVPRRLNAGAEVLQSLAVRTRS